MREFYCYFYYDWQQKVHFKLKTLTSNINLDYELTLRPQKNMKKYMQVSEIFCAYCLDIDLKVY